MKRLFSLLLIICACLSIFGYSANASSTISYRGRLVNASGAPVEDGSHTLKFIIYDAPATGNELWNSGLQFVTTTDGLFTYQLGSSAALPANLFSNSKKVYLGITVSTDPEILPRTEFTSAAFALQSEHADLAESAKNAEKLGDKLPSFYLAWNNLSGIPAGFADGIDNVGSGDITSVTSGGGLTGGGTSGAVSLSVASGGINAGHIGTGAVGASEIATDAVRASEIATGAVGTLEILNGTITNIDIRSTAAIATTKISGTAMNLSSTQTASGTKTFNNLRIATTTRRISIPFSAFTIYSLGIIERSFGSYVRVDANGTFVYYAPILLPDGAIVTQLEGTFRDIDNQGRVAINLKRVAQSTGIGTLMAGNNTTNAFNTGNPTTLVDNTIANATVNNELYFYVLGAELRNSNLVDGIRLYGAEVTYTITKPLP